MAKRDGRFDRLLREAERAAGAIRAVADDLSAIIDALPARERTRRRELTQFHRRLTAVADLLMAEAAALNVGTTRMTVRVARVVLVASGAIGLAAATGAAEGGVAQLAERMRSDSRQAVVCINAVEEEAVTLEEQLDRLAELEDAIKDIRQQAERLMEATGIVVTEDEVSVFPGFDVDTSPPRHRASYWYSVIDEIGRRQRRQALDGLVPLETLHLLEQAGAATASSLLFLPPP